MIGYRTHLSNRKGKLYIDGRSAEALARRFGTPLYVYSAARIYDNATRLIKALQTRDQRIRIAYSLKANPNPALLDVINEVHVDADCASIEELRRAKRAGFKKRIFTGVYASKSEIQEASRFCDMLVLDDIDRLRHVPLRFSGILAFRVNPGKGTGLHPGLITGGDTKFGIPTIYIVGAYEAALRRGFRRLGLHAMVGSGALHWRDFVRRAKTVLDVAALIKRRTGVGMEEIDMGGGHSIPYRPSEKPLDIDSMAKGIAKLLCMHTAAPETFSLEPGRYIVGDAAVILARVTAVKTKPRHFVGIDAGMHTLIRPALYDAYHEVLAAEHLNSRSYVSQTIVGPICETADVLAEKRLLPKLKEGDLVAILDTGAYGAVMASRYGTRGLPREVLIDRKTVRDITAG